MAESLLSVRWKDHTSELATVYKSLLENNFLVDCTISAEGQSLKAHRLILSACSPYFHMLFDKESGKDAFVILLDASFETLKAVIDFVYRGETQIPERNLKAFLALAQSLQIKGLNAFSKGYKNKKLPDSLTENVTSAPSDNNEGNCEVQDVNATHKDSSENYSLQNTHHSDGYSDTVHKNSSIPFGEYSAMSDEIQSASAMTPSQEHQTPLGREEASVNTGIPVKHEPLYSVFSEPRNEILGNVKNAEPLPGNFTSQMDPGTASKRGEEDLNRPSSCSESSHGNAESSVLPSSQQQLMQLNTEVSSARVVAEENEHLLPAILVPKTELMDDEASEEPMDDLYVLGDNGSVEGTDPLHDEENLDQCSRADGLPQEAPLGWLAGRRLWSRGSQEGRMLLPHSDMQLPGDHHSGEGSFPDVDGASHSSAVTEETHFSCDVCGVAFKLRSDLLIHNRAHTGERPYVCDVCGNNFARAERLSRHMLTHTGERPYRCDVCGKCFNRKDYLSCHKRLHTGERPHHCDVCGKSFIQRTQLVSHMRTHTGERPYCCEMCGISFAERKTLSNHRRTHTGEKPYQCMVCGKRFTNGTSLGLHKRKHAAERQ